ncbi:MAG: DUF4185 domain-containing protein [Gemmatimonadetes bacterium]|nr:DUF4185 domain-containing protein [Gemmatimonadota bacterium]
MSWDFPSALRVAPGSDLWPVTWGPDDALYTSWGDGGGFGGTDGEARVSLGFARITGPPEAFVATNLWGGKDAERPATFAGKATGLLSVGGTLYAWINLQDGDIPARRLAWSTDLGRSWQLGSWSFPGARGALYLATFLNFGRDYAGARDGFVYAYGKRYSDAGDPFTDPRNFLARVPRGSVRERGAYEFFAGFDAARAPTWTRVERNARSILTDTARTKAFSVVHVSPIGRYVGTTSRGNSVGKLSIHEAAEPWGPWISVVAYDNWGGFGDGEGLLYSIPTKWIGGDGTTLWMIFSSTGAFDSFNLVRGTLTLR